MSVQVTREQVSAAKLRLALDKAQGRSSDEWAVRVANAVDATKDSAQNARAS